VSAVQRIAAVKFITRLIRLVDPWIHEPPIALLARVSERRRAVVIHGSQEREPRVAIHDDAEVVVFQLVRALVFIVPHGLGLCRVRELRKRNGDAEELGIVSLTLVVHVHF
jgi:hypothetical protein